MSFLSTRRLVVALALGAFAACGDPASPDTQSTHDIEVTNVFATGGASGASLSRATAAATAVQITKVRLTVVADPSGSVLFQKVYDVDPAQAKWTLPFTAPLGQSIRIVAELISVTSGVEKVEYSGEAGPLSLNPCAADCAPIPVKTYPGTTENLGATGIAISPEAPSVVEGATTSLTAAVLPTGPSYLVSWKSLDPTVATVDANGKVRAASGGTADIIASLDGISGTAQLVVDGPPAAGNAPATANATGAAAVLALMEPTIDASQVPASVAWYESNFKKWGDIQWNSFGPRWDAGNSNAGYDRAAINYVWWARTGDTTYLNRAHATAVAYRNGYLVPASFMTSPHWSQIEGLYLDWIVTGDTESRDAVLRMANVLWSFDPYLDALYKDWLDNRIQARVLLAYWMAEKIDGPNSVWTSRINAAIPRILALQDADGHWGFQSTCGGSWNFMTGMLGDVLSRMYNQRNGNGGNNPAILTALTKAANYLWNTQWRPSDQSFNYASLECLGAGGPTSAVDLNGLILPMYGWLGRTTGDASWFTKGDAIMAGMTGADIELYKQFSESYTSSYRYLGYRYGR